MWRGFQEALGGAGRGSKREVEDSVAGVRSREVVLSAVVEYFVDGYNCLGKIKRKRSSKEGIRATRVIKRQRSW